MPGQSALQKTTPVGTLRTAFAAAGLPSYAGARTRRYDPAGNAYNWKPSNTRKLRASLGKAMAGTAIANHAFAGDSETDCFIGTGNDNLNMWPRNYRAALNALGVPIGGTGLVKIATAGSAIDPRWTLAGGTWTAAAQGNAWAQVSTSGATATFASGDAGTKVDVAYFNTAAAFTVAIDGGSAVTVTPTGASTIAKYSVTGLANTTHTVVITTTSASTVYLIGANVYGASGLLVHNMGFYGSQSSSWTSSSIFTGYREAYHQALPTLTPDVLWIALGVNDINAGGRTPTAVTADLTTLRNAYSSSDAILVAQYQPTTGTNTTWPAYVSALYDLADTLDVPLLDLYDRSGGYTTANANGLMGDTVHPNAAAQRDWGRAAAMQALR